MDKKLNTIVPFGYNIKNGGKKLYGPDNPFYGKRHNISTKLEISKKNTGRKATEEERQMRHIINSGKNNPFYGKHHSEEAKRKIKEANIKSGNYEKSSKRMKENNPNDGSFFSKSVVMLDKENNILNFFKSAVDAGKYIKENEKTKAKHPGNQICAACNGKQKTAYGYIWHYYDFPLKKIKSGTTGFIIRYNNEHTNFYF